MRGPPNLLAQIGSPAPRFAALGASLTAAPQSVPQSAVPDPEDIEKETAMTIISATLGSSGDPYARLVEGLRMELGCNDIAALADRIFEAEKADFHWQARVRERYLGQHFPLDFADEDANEDVSRMAILSFVAARWHAGICLVDGDGCALDLLWLRSFDRRDDAAEAFARAR